MIYSNVYDSRLWLLMVLGCLITSIVFDSERYKPLEIADIGVLLLLLYYYYYANVEKKKCVYSIKNYGNTLYSLFYKVIFVVKWVRGRSVTKVGW